MLDIGYPAKEFEYHKRQHQAFAMKLTVLKSASTWELLDYVREWLLMHIIAVDSKVGVFMRRSSGAVNAK